MIENAEEYRKRRKEELCDWLKDNIKAYEAVKTIQLHDFVVDWEELDGEFSVTIDGETVEDKFSLCLTGTGRVAYGVPIFHSPLGTVASYAAIELSEEIRKRISQVLDSIFPKFRAYGIHNDINHFVTQSTPLNVRTYDDELFNRCKHMVDAPGFSLTINF